MTEKTRQEIADDPRAIYDSGDYCAPIRERLQEDDIESAYAIQEINTDFWLADGRRLVGRKIGLTSQAV